MIIHEEERTRAMAEIIYNPYPITDKGFAKAKPLYDIYCGICHGEKGDGNGYLSSTKTEEFIQLHLPIF